MLIQRKVTGNCSLAFVFAITGAKSRSKKELSV